jgi:DNA topoisomerase-6 subunit B
MKKRAPSTETAVTMAARQRDIAVSEFFLKNRHLLGFDNPRRALLTTVKEAVDNGLDACEEAGILPEMAVDIAELAENRFRVSVTDNGPGIVRAQIPRIFAKLLYGSKFHRLRMSRGQQGIGISAAGMYGQLTTGSATRIDSRVEGKAAHHLEVQIDTRKNTPAILKDHETPWHPAFPGEDGAPVESRHGTCVSIDMEASYVRGRLSVDEYLKQCAIVNPHLRLHFRVTLLPKEGAAPVAAAPADPAGGWTTYARATELLPKAPLEIKPHPHGVELGMLMQMLKASTARSVKSALAADFSRVSPSNADAICRQAGLDPLAKPSQIAHHESEALFKALNAARLMRPQVDCLSPIGEELMVAGLRKEVPDAFYAAVSRPPAVYRGNPFQIEAALAYLEKGDVGGDGGSDEPVQVLRFANRVPLLHMAGGCAMTKAALAVNWKAYGLAQPKGSLPVGPVVLLIHMASVWVPFTSESKDAVAHYPEIIREMTFALQELGRLLSVHLGRRHREDEAARKQRYIELYLPHLALGLRQILGLTETEETALRDRLRDMLERARAET